MRLKVDIEKLNVDGGFVDIRRWFKRYEIYLDTQRQMKSEDTEIHSSDADDENDRAMREQIYLKYLPLHLTGSILCCFEELDEEDTRDYNRVKEQLVSFYSIDRATAYSRFVESKYTGTGVDLYVAEMRKYLGVLGIKRDSQDALLLEQFLRGIPDVCAAELRSRCGKEGDDMELGAVIQVARTLRSLQLDERGNFVGFAGTAGWQQSKGREQKRPPPPPPPQARAPEAKTERNASKVMSCFACSGNHRMCDCPIMQAFRASGNVQSPSTPAGSGMGSINHPAQH